MGQPIRAVLVAACLGLVATRVAAQPLGLPPVPIPQDNPQSTAKIELGDKLFNDERLSSTGEVSCASCHDPNKAFTDTPAATSEGVNKLTGTRNAPTVLNAAYYELLFWDGRAVDLEDQSQHPMVNPVEMGLSDHDAVLKIVRSDPHYLAMFREAFGKEPAQITMKEVRQAIASFERTLVSGDSPFDRWYFGHDQGAISEQARRGFAVFMNQGRCVACHVIEQDQALFTDNRFHNVGVGIDRIRNEVSELASVFLEAKQGGMVVDKAVLANPKVSELGRFVVTGALDDIGAFKTPSLRNVSVTAPFMHDGSLRTLRDVLEHHDGGKMDRVSDDRGGGVRPPNLTGQEITDLVAFLEALTSPQFAAQEQAGPPTARK